MLDDKCYLTIRNVPRKYQRKAQLWKPILQRDINDIYLDIITVGITILEKELASRYSEIRKINEEK